MAKVVKIMITGGHVTPAIAVIDRLREKKINCDIVFVGRKYTNEWENKESFEYKEITARNIKFIYLKTGRFMRYISVNLLWNLILVPVGFVRSLKILFKNKPDIILSFGGYIAFPIAFTGKLLGKKVYTHEQTVTPGVANKLVALISKKVFISFPESAVYFPGNKIIISGNPIRKSVFTVMEKLPIKKNKPCIYVTGGALGAHAVNVLIEKILPSLLKKYIVIHQTGNVVEFSDYHRLMQYKKRLPEKFQVNYHLQEHFADSEIGSIYSLCDIVIGRAGANTFFELVALKKPAILIPLPWAANNEQKNQAAIFKKFNTGEVFSQNDGPQKLLELIDLLITKKDEYSSRFEKFPPYIKNHAEDIIISEILKP